MPGPFAKISKCLPRPGDFWWAFIVILPFLDRRKWLSASPFSVDSWAGVDKIVPFKLRVSETTRAEREGRAGKSKGQVSGDEVAAEDREAEEGEDDDEDDEEGDWDSDDSGTEESGSDSEEEEDAAEDGKEHKDKKDRKKDGESPKGPSPKKD